MSRMRGWCKKACEICGYSQFPVMTRHHVYGKGTKEDKKARQNRFMVVCPNCHIAINKGLISVDYMLKEAEK